MDSLNIIMSSLADLVEGNAPEDMKIIEKLVCQKKEEEVALEERNAHAGIRAQNDKARTCSGGSCALGGTTNSSSQTKPPLGQSDK